MKGKVFASNFYLENSPITFTGDLATLPGLFYDPNRKTEAPVITGSATQDFYTQFLQSMKSINDSLTAIDRRYTEEYTLPMMNDKNHQHDYTAIGVAIAKDDARWKQAHREKTMDFIFT